MAKLVGMMNFSGGEFLVILFIALLLIGPERLPQYAAQLGRLVRSLKEMMAGAKTTLKDELGDDYAELQKFDPRQYDPRRIVREALLDDVVPATKRAASTSPLPENSVAAAATGAVAAAAAPPAAAPAPQVAGTAPQVVTTPDAAVGAPFDDEAT